MKSKILASLGLFAVAVTISGPRGAKVHAGFGGAQGVPVVTVCTGCTPELDTASPTGLFTPWLTVASGLAMKLARWTYSHIASSATAKK